MPEISITRGDTLFLKLRFRNKSTALPINIANWFLYVTFKADLALPDSSTSVIQQTFDLATPDALKFSDLSAANGEVTLRFSPEKTKLFSLGRTYHWDIQRRTNIIQSSTLVDTDVQTYFIGTAKIVSDVTQNYLSAALGSPA